MSNLPISSKYRSTPNVPVDDRERDSVVARVNAAFESGAVDDWTYRQLLDTAFSATTLGQLAPVVEKLPPAATYAVPAIVEEGSGRPGELTSARAPSGRTVLALVGTIAAAIVVLVVLLAILL